MTPPKPHLLVLTSRFPDPPTGGDTVRVWHQVRRLARHYRITWLTFGPEDSSSTEIASWGVSQTVVAKSRVTPLLHAAVGAIRGLPLQIHVYASSRMSEALRLLLTADRPDVAFVQLSRLGPYVDQMLDKGVPVVVDFVDSLAANMSGRANVAKAPLSWVYRWESWRTEKYERALARRINGAIAVSSRDADRIAPLVHIDPNGVDLDEFPFAPVTPSPHRLLFWGNMGYHVNSDAALRCAHEILPRVQARYPDTTLAILGHSPTAALKDLGKRPDVWVSGRLKRLAPELANGGVAAFPLRVGAGVQNKALEAMASGIPIVTTPTVAAGLSAATPGVELLVGDTEDAIASHICDLFASSSKAQSLVDAARALVESEYTWNGSIERLRAVLESARNTQ